MTVILVLSYIKAIVIVILSGVSVYILAGRLYALKKHYAKLEKQEAQTESDSTGNAQKLDMST